MYQVIVRAAGSTTWVGLGWRPASLNSTCKQFWGGAGREVVATTSTRVPRLARQAEDPADRFTPKGEFHAMDCTDIVVGRARGGLGRIVDSYTRDRSTPLADSQYGGTDSLTGGLAWEEEGDTVMMFRKPLVASHQSDHSLGPGPLQLIWAVGCLTF